MRNPLLSTIANTASSSSNPQNQKTKPRGFQKKKPKTPARIPGRGFLFQGFPWRTFTSAMKAPKLIKFAGGFG